MYADDVHRRSSAKYLAACPAAPGLPPGILRKHERHLARTCGFTILEVLIVLALGTLLVAATFPTGLRFYQNQIADETAGDIKALLSRAASESRLGKDGSAFGVRFFPDRLIFFRGTSYATRDTGRDEIHPLPPGATLTAPADEIVFGGATGVPSATGTIVVSLFGTTFATEVGENGMIARRE